MRTNVILGMMLSIGVAGALITGSGFAAMTGLGDPVGAVDDRVQEQANASTLGDGNVSGKNAPGDDANIISLVISGAQRVGEIVAMVVLLPMTLINMGFPPWFAIPVGAPATIISSIGIIQFATGRVLR